MRQLLLAALPLLLFSPQTVEPDDPREREMPVPPPVSEHTRRDFQALLAQMQGGWQLVGMHLPDAMTASRQEVAFLLVAQEFMSIEIHMGFFDEGQRMEESYFQSGTYRLSPDERGYMIAMTLIGAVFDERERLVFEPPGLRRRYVPTIEGDQLKLVRHPDGARFLFERMRTEVEFDFYGRPLEKQPAPAGEAPAPAPRRRKQE